VWRAAGLLPRTMRLDITAHPHSTVAFKVTGNKEIIVGLITSAIYRLAIVQCIGMDKMKWKTACMLE